MARDQRLVQTAVMGSAESEVPVLLPMLPAQAHEFRSAHVEDTFWCGQWLGGCRGRLTIKVPANRVAHFAHIPGHGSCRRASVGVEGADHLYIKQQFLAWLSAQGISAAACLPEDAERFGGEVLFEPGGHGCLRVLLDQEAALPTPVAGTQLLLGPDIAHDPHQLTLDGYVLRIRCDTDGHARRVMIGTQLHGHTEWVSLDDCSFEPWGLSTPAVEEVRRLRSSSRPLTTFPHRTAPARPAAARPVATPQAANDRQSAFDALRTALDGERSTTEVRHCLARAEAAASGGATAEENALLRSAADLLLRRDRGVGISAPVAPVQRRSRVFRSGRTGMSRAGAAAEAVADLLDTLERRDHLRPGEQQRLVAQLEAKAGEAGPWLTRQQRERIASLRKRTQPAPAPVAPPPTPAAKVSVLPAAAAAVTARVRTEASERRRRGGPRPASAPVVLPAGIDAVADAARDVLKHAARLGTTVSWDRLCAQVKGMHELSEDQQRRALQSASDRSRSATPLAALITIGRGMPHPHALRLATSGDGPDGRAAWQQVVASVHASFRPGLPPPGARPADTR